jgi:hypothetical protein
MYREREPEVCVDTKEKVNEIQYCWSESERNKCVDILLLLIS